jgi:hypothetical protein
LHAIDVAQLQEVERHRPARPVQETLPEALEDFCRETAPEHPERD